MYFIGYCFLSGLASGYWNSIEDLKNIWKSEKIFEPQSEDQRFLRNWNNRIKILIKWKYTLFSRIYWNSNSFVSRKWSSCKCKSKKYLW